MRTASIWLTLAFAAMSCVFPAGIGRAQVEGRPTFETVGSILGQPEEVIANSPNAHLVGVVTSAEKRWGSRIHVQDETGGILVLGPDPDAFRPGDLVEVRGVINTGQFAPIVAAAKAVKIGERDLPKAKEVSVGELFTGGNEGQWVEIEGWVRSVWQISPSLVAANLVSGGARISIRISHAEGMKLDGLVGARVRIRGVASVVRSRPVTRQILEVRLFAASPADFRVEERDSRDPRTQPLLSYVQAFQYRPGSSPGARVRVAGTVTYQAGNMVYLSDGASGLAVRTAESVETHPGEQAEVIGFPDVEHFLPILSDAVLIAHGDAPAGIRPAVFSGAALHSGLEHANFVSVQAKLIDRMERPAAAAPPGEPAPDAHLVLSLQTEAGVFEAEVASTNPGKLPAKLEIGSVLEVSGICLVQPDADGTPAGFKLLAPTEKNIRVLQAAPFFNTQRLLMILCGALAVLLLIAAWAARLTAKNARLTAEIRERTAIASERSRLARDLHDTLEQSLVGIDLQIASADLAVDDDRAETREHLASARGLVKHSHYELRQSIWNLRGTRTEAFDLTEALRRIADGLLDGSGIRITVERTGEEGPPLGALVEENLLRIGQEAITNAVKHSGASQIHVRLDFRPDHTELSVTDDGAGFAANFAAAEAAGHFGLVGMRERANRIGGTLALENDAKQGAVVRIVAPRQPEATAAA